MKRPSGLQWGLPKIVSLAVAHELAHRAAREVLQPAAAPAPSRFDRKASCFAVRRDVRLVLGRRVGADAPRRAALGGHLAELVVPGALRA